MSRFAVTLVTTFGLLVGQSAIAVKGLPTTHVTAAERAINHGLGLLNDPAAVPNPSMQPPIQEEPQTLQE